MKEASMRKVALYTRFAQITVGVMGIAYSLAGVALIFFPLWFFQHIGNFPPFNRHYEGDTGAFLLPLGIGLLLATPRPQKWVWVIRLAALAGLFHAANHLYDALLYPSINAWVQTIAILVGGLVLGAASLELPASKH